MSVDFSKAIGYEAKPIAVSWTQRDLLLYAAGVGAKKDDLSFTYELHPKWAPLPTYPVVLRFKGRNHDVVDFKKLLAAEPIPGLPKLDPMRVVHGSQSVEIFKEIPHTGGDGWKMTSKVVGVHENKSGLIIDQEAKLIGPDDAVYTKLYSSSFYLGTKGTGEKYSKNIAGPPQAKAIPKDRKPDYVIHDQTTPEQAVIYRLSGDYNPLHIDPAPGKKAGFGGVILHGLATYGFVARSLISNVAGGDPSGLKLFSTRFTSPVVPGDALETSVWEIGKGPEGTTEVVFVTKNLRTGKTSLGQGVAYIKKAAKQEAKL